MKKRDVPATPQKTDNPGSKPAPVNGKQRGKARYFEPFPVVGIGASAGGLEALELFFKSVPETSDLAYVIIQHLDPTHKGVMVELLQRYTTLPVAEAKERMRVEPGHIYVIPPNKNLSILNNALHLFEAKEPRGLRLPIDFFFRALAQDRKEMSVGVILSGMGSDGMLGLQAIKEQAGAGFVQDPATAKFDGMPRSAIEAGLADVTAPVEQLHPAILGFLNRPHLVARPTMTMGTKAQSALARILIQLRAKTGHDFTQYKKSTIYRRIERRMGLHQIDKIAVYAKYIQENPEEAGLLFKELLIGVTSFFRDPYVWDQLKELIRKQLKELPKGGLLRAWIPGCSTGEEAFSLAILFLEVLDEIKTVERCGLQIFGTDLDADAIDKARSGLYPANISADVSAERLRRFFVKEEHGYRVGKQIRDCVIFAPQNVIMDPPFTKLDFLICRNLLIYLDSVLQKKLIPLFHYALKPDGILCLGNSETVGTFSDLFTPLDNKTRTYRRLNSMGRPVMIDFPSGGYPPASPAALVIPAQDEAKESANVKSLADEILLQDFTPAAVITNEQGDILYFSGRTGKYLEPASGKASLNVFAMAREGLRVELTSAFHRALRQEEAVRMKGLRVRLNGGFQAVDLTVKKLDGNPQLKGLLISVFRDVEAPAPEEPGGPEFKAGHGRTKIEQVRQELQAAREELQLSREEMQASQEELKSTNEELQSTNEELTTSKEEMQSMNEELQTVNLEMQSKLDDLAQANNDLRNLLNNTDIATLFLDESLNVRRFTPQTTKIFKLILSDVGRPITDIVTELNYPDMAADAQGVLENLVYVEKSVSANRDRWFQVRIMPYRTLDNRIDGVVLTFSDISTAKKLEASLRESEQLMLNIIQNMPDGFALLESIADDQGVTVDGRFLLVNKTFESQTGLQMRNLEGRTLKTACCDWGIDKIQSILDNVGKGGLGCLEPVTGPGGKTFSVCAYRPEEAAQRFCLMLRAVTPNQ